MEGCQWLAHRGQHEKPSLTIDNWHKQPTRSTRDANTGVNLWLLAPYRFWEPGCPPQLGIGTESADPHPA